MNNSINMKDLSILGAGLIIGAGLYAAVAGLTPNASPEHSFSDNEVSSQPATATSEVSTSPNAQPQPVTDLQPKALPMMDTGVDKDVTERYAQVNLQTDEISRALDDLNHGIEQTLLDKPLLPLHTDANMQALITETKHLVARVEQDYQLNSAATIDRLMQSAPAVHDPQLMQVFKDIRNLDEQRNQLNMSSQ